ATILTMVKKKQTTFVDVDDQMIDNALANLTEDTKPEFGKMTPQQMMEHLETGYKIAAGEIQDFEVVLSGDELDDAQSSLWSYDPMPKVFNFPLYKDGKLPELKYEDLDQAKEAMKVARKQFQEHFKKHPQDKTKHPVFGELTKYDWELLHRKHLNHHFHQFKLI